MWAKVLTLIAMVIAVFVSLLVSFISGKGFDLKLFFIVLFSLAIVFGIGFGILCLPSVKGRIGEMRVNAKLKRLVKHNGGSMFHNVIVSGEDGKTSQIDHIYVCSQGVFVIETKNYAGRIYGKDDQQQWTQVLNYGRTKNKLYNPVKQNWTHIFRLMERLGNGLKFENFVVFVHGNIAYIESDYVHSLADLCHIPDDYAQALSQEEVEKISSGIESLTQEPTKTAKEHVQEIRQTQRTIEEGICPRCGGKLVLRKAKNTGNEFYGCSNYPKCKFTKKAD